MSNNAPSRPYSSRFGFGTNADIDDPMPWRMEVPTREGLAVVTFWYHPIDLSDLAMLRRQGITTDLRIGEDLFDKSTGETRKADPVAALEQNLHLLTLGANGKGLIDRAKGWDDLIKNDGSEWPYVPPTDEQVGTTDDMRVKLATRYPWVLNVLKIYAAASRTTLRYDAEGNSESSPVTTTVTVEQ